MTMNLIAATATALMLASTAATAASHTGLGGPSAAAASTGTQSSDWSGFYLGGSIGAVTGGELTITDGIDSETIDLDSHSPIGGFIGYQVQRGQFVFGGEYAITAAANATFGGGNNEFAAAYGDLKARAGFASGPVLFYGVAGTSALAFVDDSDQDITGLGFGFGAGADYAVSPNFVIGAEFYSRITEGDINALGTTLDSEVDATTLTFRAAYKF